MPELLLGSLTRIDRILADLHPVCEVRWVGGDGHGAVETWDLRTDLNVSPAMVLLLFQRHWNHQPSVPGPLTEAPPFVAKANRSLLLYHVAAILCLPQYSPTHPRLWDPWGQDCSLVPAACIVLVFSGRTVSAWWMTPRASSLKALLEGLLGECPLHRVWPFPSASRLFGESSGVGLLDKLGVSVFA